jgi:hypothetical protein
MASISAAGTRRRLEDQRPAGGHETGRGPVGVIGCQYRGQHERNYRVTDAATGWRLRRERGCANREMAGPRRLLGERRPLARRCRPGTRLDEPGELLGGGAVAREHGQVHRALTGTRALHRRGRAGRLRQVRDGSRHLRLAVRCVRGYRASRQRRGKLPGSDGHRPPGCDRHQAGPDGSSEPDPVPAAWFRRPCQPGALDGTSRIIFWPRPRSTAKAAAGPGHRPACRGRLAAGPAAARTGPSESAPSARPRTPWRRSRSRHRN